MNYSHCHNTQLPANCLLVIVLCFLIGFQNLNAQNDKEFRQDIDNLTSLRPKQYATIDSIFKKYSTDSLKVKAFIKASHDIDYIEGESYALNALGVIYRNISHYEQSISTHQRANELATAQKNIEFEIMR